MRIAPAGLVLAVVIGTVASGASGQSLPPPLDTLPDIPLIPGAPGAPDEPDPPATEPDDIAAGSSVPAVCTGGVLRPGGNLQRFADTLKVGETGCLRRGVYKGGVDLRKPQVTLRSYPGARATIKGGQVRLSPSATGAEVYRLRLVSDIFSPLVYASRAVIANNDITNHHTDICVHVDRYPGTKIPSGVVISENRIHGCGLMPPQNHDHGIYVASARNLVIRDNLIYDNADRGIQLYPNAQRTRVIGNVIDGNGEGVIFGSRTNHTLVKNNIISNSLIRHNVESSGSMASQNVVRDNCLWSARGDYYGGEPPKSGVLQGTPGFVLGPNVIADPEFGNRIGFHPNPASPCARFRE
jgi:parallel beta-helix repeat protein